MMFLNSVLNSTTMRFNTKSSQFEQLHHKYQPKTYDLVLFPSYIQHYVTQNTTDIQRLSLAFNTFVEGHINNMILSKLKI